jgi:hypothetical protein
MRRKEKGENYGKLKKRLNKKVEIKKRGQKKRKERKRKRKLGK